jgi:2-dehydropantoate 2-reductase
MEAYRMGRAKDIRLSFDDPIDYVTKFGQSIRNGRPSMLLDHMARRPSEIDAINGQVPVLGKELGIDAPYNQALSAVVRAREEGFETARR